VAYFNVSSRHIPGYTEESVSQDPSFEPDVSRIRSKTNPVNRSFLHPLENSMIYESSH
jgi:hypothetical protein